MISQTYFKAIRFVTVVATVSLFYHIDICQTASKGYKLEYGHALRQDLLFKYDDTEVNNLIKFVEQFARKRFPWGVPRPNDQNRTSPEVLALKKWRLLYSYDDREPFYYDDTGWDRAGHQYGITRMFTLGTMYSFSLGWAENQLIYTHNFTVMIYPTADDVNLFTHTFYVQYVNQSSSNTKTYLFPKFQNQYLIEKSKYLRPLDIYVSSEESFKDMESKNSAGNIDHVTDDIQSDYCTDGLCKKQSESKEEIKYFKYKSGQFSVMSYNIWNMNSLSKKKDGYERRISQLKKTILKADPDILGLQEVRYEEGKGGSLGANQIHTLAEALTQYQYVYQPAQVQDQTLSEGKSEEGVAIMSKYPIISHDYLLLFINRSDTGDMHQRVLLHAEIYVPTIGKVHVLTTHFSLSHVAREQCALQIEEYAKQLQGPVILTGDFNAEPHEPSIQFLRGKELFPGQRGVFEDVWESYRRTDQQGFTFSILERKPSKRIDYIFFKKDADCCDIQACDVLDDGNRGVQAASDHLPLMATFSVKDHIKTT